MPERNGCAGAHGLVVPLALVAPVVAPLVLLLELTRLLTAWFLSTVCVVPPIVAIPLISRSRIFRLLVLRSVAARPRPEERRASDASRRTAPGSCAAPHASRRRAYIEDARGRAFACAAPQHEDITA